MNNFRTAAALLTLTLSSVAPLTAIGAETCGLKTTNIYIGNGVGVSRAGARASRNALQQAYANQLATLYPNEHFNFGISYNPTRGVQEDVQEVFLQRNPASPRANLTSAQLMVLAQMRKDQLVVTEARIEQLRNDRTYTGAFLDIFISDDAVAVAEEAATSLREVLSDLDRFTSLVGTNEHQSQLYRNNLLAGQRVVIVAHSQGNLFANDNVARVIGEDATWASSIGIVGVATPANTTVNGGTYVTAHDDAIIDGLRRLYTVLASNIENDLTDIWTSDPRDTSNHYFVQSYLNPVLPSRANIDTQLLGFAQNLSFPQAEVGDGALRATLQWGSEPDVDLHIYEPDGTHVDYRNKTGTSGKLDRDDTTSFGPENYFVACNDVQAGTYQFGVNYYSGSNPENAQLQLTTSDGQLTSANQLLSTAVGSSGNESPTILITLQVTIDSEGKITYSPTTP